MVLTGHRRETLRLVVAISLSGSAVNFSLTVSKTKCYSHNFLMFNGICSLTHLRFKMLLV